MGKLLKYSVLALALALASSTYARAETVTVAYGGTLDSVITFLFGWLLGNQNQQTPQGKPEPPKTVVAPEIDPESAMGALVLVGGLVTVMRSRRDS